MSKSEIIVAVMELEDENTLLRIENEGLKKQQAVSSEAKEDLGKAPSGIMLAFTHVIDLDSVFDNLNAVLIDGKGETCVSLEKFIGNLCYQSYYQEARAFSKYCSVSEAIEFFKEPLAKEYERSLAKQKKDFNDEKEKGAK